MADTREKFKIKIIYKSGAVHEFEVYSFSKVGNTYKWNETSVNNKPIQIGADDIAAVWQVGVL